MNKITIRIIPTNGIEVSLSVINDEVPIQYMTRNNLEMWK